MTSQPWIRDFGVRRSLEGYALQWSHDLSAMDTCAIPGRAQHAGGASMEP